MKAAVPAAFLLLSAGEASSFPAAVPSKSKTVNQKSATTGQGASSFAMPDFAFPETVERDAEAVLNAKLKDGDGCGALRAAMQIIVARNQVSGDPFNKNVALLDSLSTTLKAPYSNLASLIEATMYQQMFSGNAWTYNNRQLPLDIYPEDPRSWSRDLFAKKCLSLVRGAFGTDGGAGVETDGTALAKEMPLSKITPIISDPGVAGADDLTVFDFMTVAAKRVLETFGNGIAGDVIPFTPDYRPSAANVGGECSIETRDIINNLYSWRQKQPQGAGLLNAIFMKADLMQGEEKLTFTEEWMQRLLHSDLGGALLARYSDTTREMPDDMPNVMSGKDLYNTMEMWLKEYPDSPYYGAVKYKAAVLSQKTMELTLPSTAMSGKEIKGEMRLGNMKEGYVLLYSIPESMAPMNSLARKDFPGKAKLLKSVKVTGEGTVPFSDKVSFSIEGLAPGYYVALPSATPKLSGNWSKEVSKWSLNVFNVTDIATIISYSSVEKDSGKVYVVDGESQRPIAGAEVRFYADDKLTKPLKTLTTDESGSAEIVSGFHRMRISYEGSVVWQYSDVYYNESNPETRYNANVLTDLSVYKPGEKTGFAVVAWSRLGRDSKLLADTDLRVLLRDANYNPVDTLDIRTDRWGRAAGEFTLPADGLLGYYNICVTLPQKKGQQIAQTAFQVAEYKAPGFFVTVESESDRESQPGQPIRFKGEVKTYSGMPVTDASVTYDIRWNPWWRMWYGGANTANYGGELTTDGEGKFELELPTSGLKGTRFESGIFTLNVSATSSSGETQSAPSLRFSIGDGLTARPNIPDKTEVKGDTVRFNVPVYDMLDHPVNKSVGYEIVNAATGKRVAGGSFRSPVLRVPAKILPSGEYKFAFTLPEDRAKVTSETAVWRKSDEKPPLKTQLWVPVTEITVPDGAAKSEVTVGTSYSDSWIFCQIADEEGIVSRKWYPVSGRNRSIEVEAPQAGSRRWVMLSGMHDLDQKVATVTLVPEADTRKMEVKATSFRDRISAGDKEKWVFNITVAGTAQAGIPALAVMSNKSLNAIAPFSWNLGFSGNGIWNRSRLTSTSPSRMSTQGTFSVLPGFTDVNMQMPYWQTYGLSLAGMTGNVMIRGTRMMKSAQRFSMSSKDEDGVVEAESVVNEVFMASADSAPLAEAPVMAGAVANDMAAEEETAADAGNGAGPSAKKEELRPVEMPLAFFKPNLNSDAEGNVNIEFETPNFNTTWQLQLAGYNDALQTAGITMDAVASKPVMVQLNQPRYLRTGDKATVTATLYNNSPESAMLHGEIVIFNPLTGETIQSRHAAAERVGASGNRTVTIDFNVGTEVSMLGIRAYAYSGNFSDGEQTVIPVLPSSTPVVESTQFYLGTGSGNFNVKLPKFGKTDAVTLKYCVSPVWECVLALPDITTPDSKNVLSLVRALYANSLATGITKRYPAIETGLKRVLEAKAEGDRRAEAALTSNLEKDAALKTVALNNTPWVNDATAETRRMANLSTLIEDGKGAQAVESLMKELKNLQNSDGGWSWCGKMPSSLFMTQSVLEYLGMMREADVLPGAAADMAKKGLAYSDRKVLEDYERSDRKFSTISMLRYLYTRSILGGGNGPSGFRQLENEVLRKIEAEWRDFGIYDKATAALLFNRTKGYADKTAPIMESLTQLASKNERLGWWYDNLSGGWNGMPKLTTTARALQAFAATEPASTAVDGLRQWLVLQKETENWGKNNETAGVIQAILSTGSDWTASSGDGLTFKVGGKALGIPEEEMLTGVATLTLDPSKVSGKELEVVKTSESPAWGGVISQYVAPINDVNAESCENLTVEKQVLLVSEGAGGQSVKEVKPGKMTLKTGDKVRVTITMTCEKDMEYVALIDERAACLEPVDQLSGYVNADGLGAYREVRDTKTSFFITYLPKGVNVVSYDCTVDRAGVYSIGIASAQSQYSPLQTAHSAGSTLTVTSR